MLIYLLRHGETAWNREGRYQGCRDIPLSPAGRAALRTTGLHPHKVYVSPLSRAVETASILFPGAPQELVPGLREIQLGDFEGHTFRELDGNPAYQAWVDSWCEAPCPNGESKEDFSRRSCEAFARLVEQSLSENRPLLAIVAHGGTQMAVMERFALPRRRYFDWQCPNGCGYLLEVTPEAWQAGERLPLLNTLSYGKGEEPK